MIKSKKIRWEEHVACMVRKMNAYKMLAEKFERKRSLGRP
jgi:hypothetical protein